MRCERIWGKDTIEEFYCRVSGHPKDLENETQRMQDWLAQSAGLNLAKESSGFLYMPKNSLTALAQDQKESLACTNCWGDLMCSVCEYSYSLSSRSP